jgi:hydrogenase/urease accessory protein HupE
MSTMAWLFVPWMTVFPVDPATARAPFEGAGGFYSGLLHPLFVPAHLLAVTGIGPPIWPAGVVLASGSDDGE